MGAADEAVEERTLGDGVRQGNGVDARNTERFMRENLRINFWRY